MSVSDDDEVPQLVEYNEQKQPEQSAQSINQSNNQSNQQSATVTQITTTHPTTDKPPVPITILTGWLGAGKSTLVSRLFKQYTSNNEKIAIINNESSASSVEPSLIISSQAAEYGTVLELANGCICCSVNGDFIQAINALLKRDTFAAIVVECSGLANPGPLIEQFWVDTELEFPCYLDAVICMVDAVNFLNHFDESNTERDQVLHQVAYSDVVIVNKSDLLADQPTKLQQVVERVQSVNPNTPLFVTSHSDVPMDKILNIHAFEEDVERAIEKGNAINQSVDPSHHSHQPNEKCDDHCHHSTKHVDPHDTSITNIVLESDRADRCVSLSKLRAWLSTLLWDHLYGNLLDPDNQSNNQVIDHSDTSRMQIFRMKGRLHMLNETTGTTEMHYLQAVQSIYEIIDPSTSHPESVAEQHPKNTRVIVIGRRLDRELLQKGFDSIFVD